MTNPLKVLVVGCGRMGTAHAKAYHNIEDFQIVGLVSRTPKSRESLNQELDNKYPLFSDYEIALRETKPDVVSINTYTETHVPYTLKAFESGAHVFLEKPLASNLADAITTIEAAKKYNKKLLLGYILRYHPSWKKFTEIAQTLGNPLVMRMNLNQQTDGNLWPSYRNILKSTSPIVDCGVHYVDIMCQMTKTKPIQVSAIGARLTDDIAEDMYNYGQLQVKFKDGSVGWYESGWGPMISETAYFLKDVIGKNGSVSIPEKYASETEHSDNIEEHTKTGCLVRHYSKLDKNNCFIRKKEIINLKDEPEHDELCRLEQEYLLKAIRGDIDLTDHMNDVLNSLKIVLAADESIKTGKTITL